MKRGHLPYILIVPVLVLVGFIYIYPVGRSIFDSFNFGLPGIGLGNYAALFNDSFFWISLKNSAIWTVGNMVVQIVVATLIALLLNGAFRGRGVSQTLILAPWIIPAVAGAVIWIWLLNPTVGVINSWLLDLGIIGSPISFFGDPNIAMGTLIFINSWKYIPIGVVFVLAALRTIPKHVYEAAALDGARAFRQFKDFTMPLIGPRLWFVGIILFAWNFSSFDLIWLTTQGGPNVNATLTLPVYIYRLMFRMFAEGKALAAGTIMAAIVLVFCIFYFRYMLKSRGE